MAWQPFAGQFGQHEINAVSKKKLIRSPTEIVCSISSLLKHWAGLQADQGKEELEAGAEALLKTALHFHAQAAGEVTGMVLLQ